MVDDYVSQVQLAEVPIDGRRTPNESSNMSCDNEPKPIPTECVSWRWNGNLGDDMIWAAQQAMHSDVLALDQWLSTPHVSSSAAEPGCPRLPNIWSCSTWLGIGNEDGVPCRR